MSQPLLPTDFAWGDSFPQLSRRLRLGIVGGGRIAVTQAMAARMSGYWDIVAGALSTKNQRSLIRAQQFHIAEDRVYHCYQQMAESEAQRPDGIDAVMITTPNHLHYDVAQNFLRAGIDVMCEKPLTNHHKEAQKLVELRQQYQRTFAVCYTMSCFPMVRQAKEMVRNGAIGKINQIHVEFMQDWMMADAVYKAEHVQWRLDPERAGLTSCTGDIGTHAQHLATFVSGLDLISLRAQMLVCGPPKQLEDTVMLFAQYSGGVPGTLIATRFASGNRAGLRLRLFGDQGGLEWDLEKPELLKYNRHGEPDQILSRGQGHGIYANVERLSRLARGFSEGSIEAWANLYTEFAVAVAANKDQRAVPANWLSYPTVEQGAQGVRFIEAVVQSHAGNFQEVSV